MSAAAPSRPDFGSAPLVIATRESRLALWQAQHVSELLQQRLQRAVQLLGMTTRGDQILDRTLSKVGGKGLFVKELEAALADGRADLAVHSLKDVPMDLPDGYMLAAVLEREDPRDAFVSPHHAHWQALPAGAVVGTSSLRRLVQLRALRPDLLIEPLRGNLDTRLAKLDAGRYDAIVLAAAGLKRLGLGERIRCLFAPEDMLPAAGQGALGLEVRASRSDLQAALGELAHAPTWLACLAERAVSRALGGSCSMPLAAHAVWQDGPSGRELWLRAALGLPPADLHAPPGPSATPSATPSAPASVAGTPAPTLVRAQAQASVQAPADAEQLGRQVAAALLGQGGDRILAGLPGPAEAG